MRIDALKFIKNLYTRAIIDLPPLNAANDGRCYKLCVNNSIPDYEWQFLGDKIALTLVFSGTTTNNWLRSSEAGVPTHQSPYMFDKEYYVKKIFFSNRTSNNTARIRVYSVPDSDTGNVGTGDTLEFDVLSTDSQVVKNVNNSKNFIWIDDGSRANRVNVNRRYGFRIERAAGGNTWNDVHCEIELEEYIP